MKYSHLLEKNKQTNKQIKFKKKMPLSVSGEQVKNTWT